MPTIIDTKQRCANNSDPGVKSLNSSVWFRICGMQSMVSQFEIRGSNLQRAVFEFCFLECDWWFDWGSRTVFGFILVSGVCRMCFYLNAIDPVRIEPFCSFTTMMFIKALFYVHVVSNVHQSYINLKSECSTIVLFCNLWSQLGKNISYYYTLLVLT